MSSLRHQATTSHLRASMFLWVCYSAHVIQMESYALWPLVPALLHLVVLTFVRAVACVSTLLRLSNTPLYEYTHPLTNEPHWVRFHHPGSLG